MRTIKEWYIDAPWGKLAMMSWGSSSAPPVLMVHGYMDTAATFILLAEHLINGYNYVAVDLPGHGKSDPFPPGPLVHQGHMIEVLRVIADHMEWQSFVYIAHSFGVFIGCLFNTIYPGRISKMICLDPLPFFIHYYDVKYHLEKRFNRYQTYYEKNFGKLASVQPTLYRYDDIVRTVSKTRKLNKKQAEVVLSRSLVEVGNGLYRLSWEPRVKTMTILSLSEDNITYILFNKAPPMLILNSFIYESEDKKKIITSKLFARCHELENCRVVNVDGHHDVHITNPNVIAKHINDFMRIKSFNKSKL